MENTQTSPESTVIPISRADQYRTAGELIEKSRPNDMFYVMIVLSSIIIAGGILTNSLAIIIGGMLVTPLLTPILVVALALATGELALMKSTIQLLLKSIGAIVGGSLVLGFIFGGDVQFPIVTNTMTATFLYFIIAVASGIAVTYAWVRKEANEVLPGIAIVVSLVPPLSWVGVAIARGHFDIALTFGIIFILNFIGIILGSLIVFSLSQFNHDRVHKAIERKHEQIIEKELKEKEEKAAQKKARDEASSAPQVQEEDESESIQDITDER
ncbi:DUF389 domain-containing protein [Candidatus Nomurabacteria bacterium]|nr:DUF389 domain-containing protein [Candidatus Nomurabacteria bacterium]